MDLNMLFFMYSLTHSGVPFHKLAIYLECYIFATSNKLIHIMFA